MQNSEDRSAAKNATLAVADCLNCASLNKEIAIHLKVEAIKQQILSKLQLKERPKISPSIPRELVAEALRKAHFDVENNGYRRRVNSIKTHHHNHHSPLSSSSSSASTAPLSSLPSSSPSTLVDQTLSDAANAEFRDVEYDDEYDSDFPDMSQSSSTSEDYYGRTSEIIAFSEPGDTLNGHTLIEFLPHIDKVHNLEVTKAILWVQLRLNTPLTREIRKLLRDHTLTLYVFRVNKKSNDSKQLDMEMLTTKKIQTIRPGWKRIDFRVPVQRWFSDSQFSKLTLLIDCVGCDSLVNIMLFNNSSVNGNYNNGKLSKNSENLMNVRHNPVKNNHKAGYRPFLVIGTKPIVNHRSKRHIINCDTRVKQCCKQSLYISFKELGWDDWIIAPKGYYANYCMGDCSAGRRTPDTFAHFHSHVIDEYRNKNPYASISPCCAPTRLSAMSLIYFDPEYNIIKADLPKMIVEDCGCT
ncbi:Inhibin beta B chain-like protein [Dinothrombium tinctorium]|uniref:Inhibin beta B chain-like protein n=1 Tax=Dinothrombium tinctorium TaxID=1965070 RepID=A0A3S3PRW0_9ACAR|nr:Inhibin beta B chain-like protein [Dinothrombium tinctorium]